MASRASRPSFASASRSLLPTGAFLVFDGWLGLAAGMIAASITTVILLVLRRRGSAGVGILLPVWLPVLNGIRLTTCVSGPITRVSAIARLPWAGTRGRSVSPPMVSCRTAGACLWKAWAADPTRRAVTSTPIPRRILRILLRF
jgi:hypothetical protein